MNFLEPYLGAIKAAVLVALAVSLFAAGMKVQGWRLGEQIAQAKAARSNEIATQSQEALADLINASKTIKAAADGAHVDVSALNTKLDTIRKEFNDANAAPLPVDCRPDAIRVRKLTSAASAVDEAIARQRAGR